MLTLSVWVKVIGIGLIGPRHASSVVSCDEAELCCFVDPAPEAQTIASSFGVLLFSSISDMLQSNCKPNAAIVCTPNNTHVSVGKELLTAGIHVMVEKPVSTTIQSGHELLQVARIHKKQLLVGHHRRFNPYITATRTALRDGAVGMPIAVSGLWALCKPLSYFKPPTEWRAMASAGGPLLINMIHEVDVLQYLFGPITRVHAEQVISQRDNEVEEGAAILFRFSSGLVGTFALLDASPSRHNFESGTGENPTIPKAGRDFYRIFGTEGTLSVGDMKLTKHGISEEKNWSNEMEENTLAVGDEVPFDEQIKHFVQVVKGKEQPICSGKDGLRAFVVCDAIKRAMASGYIIDIRESKL